MRLLRLSKVMLLMAFALISFHSYGQTWGPVTAHVSLIDPSGMGSRNGDSTPPILFNIDHAITGNPCATTGTATANLLYLPMNFVNGTGDTAQPTGNDRQMVNSRAILTTLQLAIATGFNVKVWGFNDTSGYCQVYEVQLLSN
jgi:hypothetical protein